MIQSLQLFLYPFAILYDFATRIRNYLYAIGTFKSSTSKICTICVGNIRVGGTGKSPFVEYLLRYSIQKNINTATLSRGYGRSTTGFLKANTHTLSNEIGDESFQYFKKFKNKIDVYVDEKRAHGVEAITSENININLIILDDAYQHRSFNSKNTILLTEFSRPFFNDFLLPFGRLRESRSNAKRANCIVVTKCPEHIKTEEKIHFLNQIYQYSNINTPVFFTTVEYSQPVSVFENEFILNKNDNVVLVCGIDNPKPFIEFCKKKYNVVDVLLYPDHHSFTKSEIKQMTDKKYDNASILTTEKDTSRLIEFESILINKPIFFLPIKVKFVEHEQDFINLFDSWVIA